METGDKRKASWHIAVGILLLGISVLLAWFIPGWYADWQDRLLMGKGVFSKREDLSFLDEDTLKMGECMKLLGETKQMKWIGYDVPAYDDYELVGEEEKDYYRICRQEIQRWVACGVLPEEAAELVAEEDCSGKEIESMGVRVSLSQQKLNLRVMVISASSEEWYESGNIYDLEKLMIVFIDEETELLYHVILSGLPIEEHMAEMLGYANRDEMIWRVAEGETLMQKEDYSSYDFASLCRAKEAKISGMPEELNFDVELEYDTFTGYAQRRVIAYDNGFGIAVSLGTDLWPDLMRQIVEEDDEYRWECTTEEWEQSILWEIYGMEMQEAEEGNVETEIETEIG